MKINVYATHNSVHEKDLKDKVVVVVDVLRATSTIITALNNGCKEIIPVIEIEEAMNIASNYDKDAFILGGERNTQPIEGFHLSNSPLGYTSDVVEGRTIMFTSTNGTYAIKKAVDARKVILAALVNVDAVVEYIKDGIDEITFVCAGTEGKFSLDDIVAAGAVISRINQKRDDIEMDDLATVCMHMYESYKDNIKSVLKNTLHYKRLLDEGYDDDIEYCLSINKAPAVALYKDGVIRRADKFE